MKTYEYTNKVKELLSSDIIELLMQIQEYKGQQTLYAETNKAEVISLLEVAKIQSTEASNKIEGIFTTNERLKLLALDKTSPKTRDEEEIAGYRDVLDTIHNNYEYISISSSYILQLHKDLFKYSGSSLGGNYKNSDNSIMEIDAKSEKRERFTPVQAWQTEEAMKSLCKAYNEAMQGASTSLLAIIPMFILDFLCIHPFNDGNGRMSRLLTLLLLYKAGYHVGKYISIEAIIEKSKETYYESLQNSSLNWHENKNEYAYFVKYSLGVLLASYRDFASRTSAMKGKAKKTNRIESFIENTTGTITKAEIQANFRDISEVTVHRTLADLLKSNKIIKIGGGRYTKYIWNREEN